MLIYKQFALGVILQLLLSHLISSHLIRTEQSTADRSPPIVMSSPCPVATSCSFLIKPLRTQRHPIPAVVCRFQNVEPSTSSHFCSGSLVSEKLHCNIPHLYPSPPERSSGGNSTKTFLRDSAQATPFERRPLPYIFFHLHRVATSDSTTSSANKSCVGCV